MVKHPASLTLLIALVATVPTVATEGGPPRSGVGGRHATSARSSGTFRVVPDTLGVRRGANLFHTFEKFDVHTGETVTFSQTQGGTISSVFARVTGSDISLIDGTLGSTITGADFYLLNPNGVIFGPNASLRIDGSFTATTANHLTFTDGVRFSATHPTDGDSLTSAPLKSFGFLNAAPGKIEFNGATINSAPGKGFFAIAGPIAFDTSTITNDSGPLTLISVNRPTEVLPGASAKDTGRTATRRPKKDEDTGIFLYISNLTTAGETPGQITLVAPKLTLNNSFITSTISGAGIGLPITTYSAGTTLLTEDSAVLTKTETTGKAGPVSMTAGFLRIAGSEIGSTAPLTSSKEASTGRVSIRAGQLQVRTGGKIIASNEGAGRTTALSLRVNGHLSVAGTDAIIGDARLIEPPDFEDDHKPHGGDIHIRAGTISVSRNGRIASNTESTGRSGNVTVAAKAIHLETDGSIESNTAGPGNGGNVSVSTDKLTIGKPGNIQRAGIFANNDSPRAQSIGGNIAIRAETINIGPGGLITTRVTGPGRAGNISVRGGEMNIERRNSNVKTGLAADAAAGGPGHGGNVDVRLRNLTVANGAQITSNTTGSGPAGNVRITADKMTIFGVGGTPDALAQSLVGSECETDATGPGGDLTIKVGTLNIRADGRLSASTFGSGPAGDVHIDANTILIDAANGTGTGIVSESVSKTVGGPGGNVWVNANDLTLLGGGRISATTFGPGASGDVNVTARNAFFSANGELQKTGLVAESRPGATGAGGSIHATFGTLSLDNGTITATTAGPGAGGSIFVDADLVRMDKRSEIAAASKGTGSAGSVAVTSATRIDLRSGSSITVKSALSDAGSIRLVAPDYITLQDSKILAEAGLNGGDVFIDPQFVILDHSTISANAILGAGGNITLIADTFLSSESAVTASSEASVQGTIDIQSPDAQVANALTALPGGFLGIEIKLTDRCPMRLSSELSSFLVIGRGGLPPAPEDMR